MAPNVYIHPTALCESVNIGAGTRIWAFVHVLPNALLGKDCNICDHVFIENDVCVGDRVTIKSGVQLWDGLRIEDDVFVGPNATFTNDRFPRSKHHQAAVLSTVIRRGASVGANATILPGLEVGVGAMVGAGSVVTRSVPPFAIAVGNPARIMGYVDTHPATPELSDSPGHSANPELLGVRGTALYKLPLVHDMRGDLSVGEFEKDLPFRPERFFMVFDVPSQEVRGEHAHRLCHQFLICVRGRCSVLVDDGVARAERILDKPNLGLYIPPMVWGVQYKYSSDAVLLVFASHRYDPSDYIRDYTEFRRYAMS